MLKTTSKQFEFLIQSHNVKTNEELVNHYIEKEKLVVSQIRYEHWYWNVLNVFDYVDFIFSPWNIQIMSSTFQIFWRWILSWRLLSNIKYSCSKVTKLSPQLSSIDTSEESRRNIITTSQWILKSEIITKTSKFWFSFSAQFGHLNYNHIFWKKLFMGFIHLKWQKCIYWSDHVTPWSLVFEFYHLKKKFSRTWQILGFIAEPCH